MHSMHIVLGRDGTTNHSYAKRGDSKRRGEDAHMPITNLLP